MSPYQAPSNAPSDPPPPPSGPSLFSRPATARRVLLAASAAEAVEMMQQDEALGASLTMLLPEDCCHLLASAVERGNIELALSIYLAMGLRGQPQVSCLCALSAGASVLT